MPSTNTITVEGGDQEIRAFWVLGNQVFPMGGNTGSHHNGDPIGTVKKLYPGSAWKIRWADLDAGQYHPRMFFGDLYNKKSAVPPLPKELHSAYLQLSEHDDILTQDLKEIARVVAPVKASKKVFGSRIRNLLFMCCTEVEAQCRGILLANQYSKSPKSLNMGDYQKVGAPLKLDQYVVVLSRFPTYPPISPFKPWAKGKPLPWYQAYNQVKHDSESKIHLGTLEHAISALVAVSILQVAQFGHHALQDGTSLFGLQKYPVWPVRIPLHLSAESGRT